MSGRKPALTEDQAREVRAAYADRHPKAKWTVRALAKSFGVSMAVINAAIEQRGAYRKVIGGGDETVVGIRGGAD